MTNKTLLTKNMTFAFWNYFIPFIPSSIFEPTNMNIACNTLHVVLTQKIEKKKEITKFVKFCSSFPFKA